MIEHAIPHSLDAERAVLGSILIDPDVLVHVSDIINADDFYRDHHKTIYRTIIDLYQQREPADFVTLSDQLDRMGKLDEIGGSTYLLSLINRVPTSGNAKKYAGIIAKKSQLRQVIHAAGQMVAMAYAEDEDTLPMAEEMLHTIAQRRRSDRVTTLKDAINRYMSKMDALHEQKKKGVITGIPTGFTMLDKVLGGLQPSDLITLAARPAVGKTSMVLNMAENIIMATKSAGLNVMMFSLEMGEEQLVRRMLSMRSGIDQSRLRTLDIDDEEWERFYQAGTDLQRGNMWIDDTPGITLTDMRSRARRIQSEHGLHLILVDYMQLMKAPSAENRVQEVSMISRELKELARELNVPVLALAQLNRSVEQRADKMPQLSDLKESGSIEQDSDIVMFIHQDPDGMKNEKGYSLNIIVAKHRNGPVGIAPLWFTPSLTRFSDIETVLGNEEEA